tara:strand:+ start:8026 stop:9396 length:1371 start_codon:yes stop_codon:yes gene_type:complete
MRAKANTAINIVPPLQANQFAQNNAGLPTSNIPIPAANPMRDIPIPAARPQTAPQAAQPSGPMVAPVMRKQAPAAPQAANIPMQAPSAALTPAQMMVQAQGLYKENGNALSAIGQGWANAQSIQDTERKAVEKQKYDQQQAAKQVDYLRKMGAGEYADAVDAGLMPAQEAFTTYKTAMAEAKNAKHEITEGADGYKYFTTGPKAGQRVLPSVEASAPDPVSAAGKVNADFNAGLIDEATKTAQLQKLSKNAGGDTINIGASDKFRETADKRSAEMFSDITDNGYKAQRSQIQIGRLSELLGNINTGAGASLQNFAGDLGINTDGLDDIQAASAIISQLVPAQRPPGSGTMSDADLALFKASLPRLINSPEGNQKIIQVMQGISEYDVQQGKIAQSVLQGEMTPSEGLENMGNVPNPLADFGSPPPDAAVADTPAPDGIEPDEWKFMSEEDRALWAN